MRAMNMKKAISKTRLLAPMVAAALLLTASAFAAAPGITGPTFNLTASAAYLTQPDGAMVYSWGYGCRMGRHAALSCQRRQPLPFCSLHADPGTDADRHTRSKQSR